MSGRGRDESNREQAAWWGLWDTAQELLADHRAARKDILREVELALREAAECGVRS